MWNQRESPSRLEKRFEFEAYSTISKFMKKVEQLCEKYKMYPNISFGKNFVSITIFLSSEKVTKIEKDFSNQIDIFYLEI
tara:strand:+ start:178 stop:417 length:240 start_codon:yes stop_codon:yes gene_type:complete